MAHPFFSRCPLATAASPGRLARPTTRTQQKPAYLTSWHRSLHGQCQQRYQPRQLTSTRSTTSSLRRSTTTPTKAATTTKLILPHQPTRSYHSSHQHTLPTHEYTNSQTTILTAALEHVPEHGFTQQALTLGARDTGFLDVSIQLLPRGEFDLVLFWLASRRGLLRGRVENGTVFGQGQGQEQGEGKWEGEGRKVLLSSLSVEEKVKMLILERLGMNLSIKGHWQGALALMSLPQNIPFSLTELHALASDILSLSGDTSVDTSWYTKRLAVSAIYASAETAMTQDSFQDMAAVEAFVERRMEESKNLGEAFDGVGKCLGFLGGSLVGVGRSWGIKI